MLKLMLIQIGGVVTHRILDSEICFNEFVELVSFENFGNSLHPDEGMSSVFVPYSETTYTLLGVYGASANELEISS